MLRSEILRKIIEEAVEEIENGSEPQLFKHDQLFKDNGIVSNMHVGCNKNKEMEQDTEESKVLKLEWFAGALVGMVESNSLFGINSWINMSNKMLR